METAGIVVFTTRKKFRGAYQTLFDTLQVKKKYEAIGTVPENSDIDEWTVESRIVPGDPFFLMKESHGEKNAKTRIKCIEKRSRQAYFELFPVTGKKHQLRIHLCRIGSGILNDKFYPMLQPESPPDFSKPLQLLAREIRFKDPISHEDRVFISERRLVWEPA